MIVAFDNRLWDLVNLDAKVEQLASGFEFTEGPVWDNQRNSLVFSDVRARRVYRWSEHHGTELIRDASGGANGNAFDPRGHLVTCEGANRRMTRTNAGGAIEVIADRYDGKRFNSPNDVVCSRVGDVLFTDPPYGLRGPDGVIHGQELPFNGVFRISGRNGDLSVLADDFDRPNGIALSVDQTQLFVADTARQHVRAFDLSTEGRLTNGRVFVEEIRGQTVGTLAAGPDGMKFDSRGNLYVAANTAEGVWVYSADGEGLGSIGLPEPPANLAWGGSDRQTLFITARSSVYGVRMNIPGPPV
jgi:sugar lactone lactonase YvrE